MTYSKINFVDRQVSRPKTYTMTTNEDNTVTLTDAFGTVTSIGTPLNAENMNHIEDGISNSATTDLDNLSTGGQTVIKELTESILDSIYPVGSIYLTFNETCPLAALFGTWQLVANDKVLQGAGSRGSVGSTLDESLPNIKGTIGAVVGNGGSSYFFGYRNGTGAFSGLESQSLGHDAYTTTANTYSVSVPTFNASRSSSTYQDNAPVQPDAILVNIFKRTA